MNRKRRFKTIVAFVLLAVMVAGLTLPLFRPRVQESAAPQQTQQTREQTGRILFVGDSRTIDMFADSDESLEGEEHDGVIVYARHGHSFYYLEWLTEEIDVNKDDTLITWMGANDRGYFPSYGALYDALLEEGVRLVVCTVGPTGIDKAEESYNEPYENKYMQQFNTALMSWAAANSVPVIDLYSYVNRNVEIDMSDGIHYLPRPDPELWEYILERLEACGVFSNEGNG